MSNSNATIDIEFAAIQNEALGAAILWEFAKAFYDNKPAENPGPTLPLFLPILPLVFNSHVVSQIHKRRFTGGLFKAVASDRSLILGLQQRTGDMAKQTLNTLNLALASGLLTIDADSTVVGIGIQELPDELKVAETSNMRAAAKRIGIWFSTLPIEQIAYLLGIRF